MKKSDRNKISPRVMMELAIEVMQKSVSEARADKKVPPKVGAVLVKPNGEVETACRGELRVGDHAEYTLLERKKRDENLTGSWLFATLEPCAPGARNLPKLGCAERIVNARIEKVWVGIEDPDPLIDRKGIRYLIDNRAQIEMFNEDLQSQIREINKEFIAGALQRAEEEEETPKPTILNSLEETVQGVDAEVYKELSATALNAYREAADVTAGVQTVEFRNILSRQGILDDSLRPTKLGIISFGEHPAQRFPEAGLKATFIYPNGTRAVKDFVEALVLIPRAFEAWLSPLMPPIADTSHMERKDEPAFPFKVIREAVINALIHRDYDITGAVCIVEVSPETIVLKSPGLPVPPITLERLQNFTAPTLSRNPRLTYLFRQMKQMEERGLGMSAFRTLKEQFGLPLPSYTFDAPYLVMTLYRTAQAVETSIPPEKLALLSLQEREGWTLLRDSNTLSTSEYAEHFGIDGRTALRHLSHLMELGIVERIGGGRGARYKLIRPS
ncbi:MAG: hypothetical protein NT023_08975 [Armatimonadetes bacterium]|nr:hypothetical protein [Armatimonadota bacterium]